MQVMKGVRVVELAVWMAGPAAGALLSDWGADVIHIEHPVSGDPIHGFVSSGSVGDVPVDFLYHTANRGKRSVGIDLQTPEGQELVYELVRTADVFLTNYLPSVRKRLKMDVEDIRAQNPNIIYARGSGVGFRGPEADSGGFDATTFWGRGGSSYQLTPDDAESATFMPAMGFGDLTTGLTLASGIAGALFCRERTGHASIVDASLLSAGVWPQGLQISLAGLTGKPSKMIGEGRVNTNPIGGSFRTSDDRFVSLGLMQAYHYWPDLARAIGREELLSDPRFDTEEHFWQNREALRTTIAGIFASAPLEEWKERLSALRGAAVWAAIQSPLELIDDPQVIANGYIQDVEVGEGVTIKLATPVQFDETPPRISPGPESWQHTELVLMELGKSWEEIEKLREAGAIR